MADDKPMRFGPAPRSREPNGQFARMPEDPEDVLKQGGRPDKWSPGLGVGTAPQSRGRIDWPPAKAPPKPYRNLQQRRS